MSSHDLEIERRRFADVARNAHICQFCNDNQVKNELFSINMLSVYGFKELYMKHYYQWPTLSKCNNIVSLNNKTVMINVAKFIYFASQLRKQTRKC